MKILILFLISTHTLCAHVIVHLQGQLGNQLFQIATAIALAQEQQCELYFPDFEHLSADYLKTREVEKNYHALYHRILRRTAPIAPSFFYYEPEYAYNPIPYCENMEICGFFQSEKYFKKYRPLLLELFAPSQEIEENLQRRFSSLLQNPNTVGIHVRTWYRDFKNFESNYAFYRAFLPPDMEYYKKAIALFDADALFVVFSDRIDWCKEQFKEIDRNFIFVEGQDYLHDFYLLSKCKHVIVGSSTFSWWAAYLNQNPDKMVVCRKPFLHSQNDPKDIICEDWITLEMPTIAPHPIFLE